MSDTTDHVAALKASIADGPTPARVKMLAYRYARMGRDAAIEFADQLYAELNIGEAVQITKNSAQPANAPATARADSKSDTSRPDTLEKTPTAKA
jgi:hypothetical protein